jgi:hypothetical protein
MANEQLNDVDRAAIDEHARHVAEQAALRKVRKTLDSIGESETAERRTLRKVLIVCAILAAVGVLLALGLVYGDKGLPQQPPMTVPDTLPPKQ